MLLFVVCKVLVVGMGDVPPPPKNVLWGKSLDGTTNGCLVLLVYGDDDDDDDKYLWRADVERESASSKHKVRYVARRLQCCC